MTSDNDIVTRLRDCTCVPHGEICREAADEIERLRVQRDEARLEICDRVSTTRWQPQFPLMTKRQYAEERGWDCFKETQ